MLEAELVLKAQKGDNAALKQLYDNYYKEVYTVALSILSSSEEAEDAVQDVFVVMIEKLSQLREPSAFHSWLKTITVNRCREYYRRREKLSEEAAEDNYLENAATTDSGQYDSVVPHANLDEKETAGMIYKIVSGLPEKHKSVIYMFYYSEMSVKSIAQQLNVSEGTVKSRLSYARKAIEQEIRALEKQGIKLYSFDYLSSLGSVVDTVANLSNIAGNFTGVTNAIVSTVGSGVSSAVSSAASSAAASAASNAISTSAANAVGAQISHSISYSVASRISVISAIVVTASVIGANITALIPDDDRDKNNSPSDSIVSVQDNKPSDNIPDINDNTSTEKSITPEKEVVYVPYEVPGETVYIYRDPVVNDTPQENTVSQAVPADETPSLTPNYSEYREVTDEQGFGFRVYDSTNEATVIQYNGPDKKKLVIPSYVVEISDEGQKKYTVTKLNRVFSAPQLKNVKTIVLPDNIKSIPALGFDKFTKLETVSFTDSVTKIEAYAFSSCRKLVNLGDMSRVSEIGTSAFYWCRELKEVRGLNSITEIDESAFESCSALEFFDFGKNLEYIGRYAFSCTALKEAVFPNSLLYIGESAFESSDIETVVLPSGLMEVGVSAFYKCHSLKNLTIPYYEFKEGDTSSHIGSWLSTDILSIIADNVLYDSNGAALSIENLTIVPADPENSEFRGIFDDESYLKYYDFAVLAKNITFADGFTGTFTGFGTNTENPQIYPLYQVESITLGEGFEGISSYAVRGNYDVYNDRIINCLDSDPQDQNDFSVPLKRVVLPSTLKTIDDYAFRRLYSLEEAVISEGTETIGRSAFRECISLKEITIPESVRLIDNCAFCGCISLEMVNLCSKDITVMDKVFTGTKWEKSEDYALREDRGKKTDDDKNTDDGEKIDDTEKGFVVPQTSEEALKLTEDLIGITGENLVLTEKSRLVPELIVLCAKQNCTMSLDGRNTDYYIEDDMLFSRDKTKLILYFGRGSEECVIPEGVTSIGDYAFAYSDVTSVTIPESVTSIGEYAFVYSELTSVVLPDSAVSVGQSAFEKSKLASVTMSNSLPSIGAKAFFSTCLVNVKIPENVTELPEEVFGQCRDLESVVLPGGLKSIGSGAFKDCVSLKKITTTGSTKSYPEIEKILEYYEAHKLLDDENLTIDDIEWGEENSEKAAVIRIRTYLDYMDISYLPCGLERIGDSAFENCSALHSVSIPDSVSEIGGYAFCNCTGLYTIDLPCGLKTVSKGTFKGCCWLFSTLNEFMILEDFNEAYPLYYRVFFMPEVEQILDDAFRDSCAEDTRFDIIHFIVPNLDKRDNRNRTGKDSFCFFASFDDILDFEQIDYDWGSDDWEDYEFEKDDEWEDDESICEELIDDEWENEAWNNEWENDEWIDDDWENDCEYDLWENDWENDSEYDLWEYDWEDNE